MWFDTAYVQSFFFLLKLALFSTISYCSVWCSYSVLYRYMSVWFSCLVIHAQTPVAWGQFDAPICWQLHVVLHKTGKPNNITHLHTHTHTHAHTHTHTQFTLKSRHNIVSSTSQWARHIPFVVQQWASLDPQFGFLKVKATFNSGTTKKKMTQ